MNIAFVLSQITPNGPFIVAKDIIDSLLEQGHSLDILYLHGEIRQQYSVVPRLVRYFEEVDFSKYDIIHSHGFRADVFVHLQQKRIRKYSKAKTVSTVHQYNSEQIPFDYHQRWKVFFVEFLWARALRSKNQIVGLTNHMAQYYQQYLGVRHVTHVHNGRTVPNNPEHCNREILQRILDAKQKYTVIGSVGLLTPRKGFDQIIHLLKARPELFSIILGEGEARESLQNLADSLGVSNRILFCGFQSNPAAYLAHVDIFCFPSRAEGFSLVIVEAASVMIPVVCTKLPFFAELYTDDEISTFQPDNLADFQKALDKVIEDRDGYAQRLHAKYIREYTREAMVKRYIQLYTTLRGE